VRLPVRRGHLRDAAHHLEYGLWRLLLPAGGAPPYDCTRELKTRTCVDVITSRGRNATGRATTTGLPRSPQRTPSIVVRVLPATNLCPSNERHDVTSARRDPPASHGPTLSLHNADVSATREIGSLPASFHLHPSINELDDAQPPDVVRCHTNRLSRGGKNIHVSHVYQRVSASSRFAITATTSMPETLSNDRLAVLPTSRTRQPTPDSARFREYQACEISAALLPSPAHSLNASVQACATNLTITPPAPYADNLVRSEAARSPPIQLQRAGSMSTKQ
jgi:hypothetical protein